MFGLLGGKMLTNLAGNALGDKAGSTSSFGDRLKNFFTDPNRQTPFAQGYNFFKQMPKSGSSKSKSVSNPDAFGVNNPGFLGDTQAGFDANQWLQQAFQDLNLGTALARTKSNIDAGARSRVQALDAANRFRGSGVNAARGDAIMADADRMKMDAEEQDRLMRFQQGLGLVGATGQFLTNPLLQLLGIQTGTSDLKRQIQAQKDMQPSDFEKGLGFVSSIFCWVARELIPERWEAARAYMVMEAPASTRELYIRHGESLAANLTDEDRRTLTPIFNEMADRGQKYLEQ